MQRKLIKHGLSSLTISLPKKWLTKNNLGKGDEVDVEESGGKLVIGTKGKREHRRIEIDISDAAPMIRKMIGAAFKSGYDEILVTFSSHDELRVVQDVMREQFAGFEIVDQGRRTITIKNLSESSFEEFSVVLKRFFFVFNQIAGETHAALSKNDVEWLRNTALMKIESDKAADYCRRAINMGHEAEFKRVAPLYVIIEQLEKTVDLYKDLCTYVAADRMKVDKDIISYVESLLVFQKQFYDLVFDFNMKKLPAFGRTKQKLQAELDAMPGWSSKKERPILRMLERILNTIYSLNGPVMAARL